MPAKFGPKWFEHSRQKLEENQKEEGEEKKELVKKSVEFDMLINDDGDIDDEQLEKFVDEDEE